MTTNENFNSACQGPWVDASQKYLGLKFLIDGEVHYGWARLNVRCVYPHPIRAVITGYAYETVANQSIITGDIGAKASGDAVGPGSLGNLALGVPPLASLRRRITDSHQP